MMDSTISKIWFPIKEIRDSTLGFYKSNKLIYEVGIIPMIYSFCGVSL
jgi:hypothetical protein